MDELSKVTGLEWNDGNSRKNVDKHGVSQQEAEQIFFSEPLIAEDEKHGRREQRYHAFGYTNEGRLLHITFT